jgi:subtilase family serine protease
LTIPAGTGTGTFYVIAKADADNAVPEAKETNNTLSRAIQIGPDLDVSALSVPAKGGAALPLVVSDTTANTGGGSASTTTTRFYLSVNSSLDAADTLIGSRTLTGLAAGEASTVSTSLPIPAGTASGSYYVFAKADADNAVTELSETNNTYLRSVKIGPDLSVSTLTASASTVAAGASVTVTDKITNDGGGSAASTVTRFYLSTNTTLDAADVVLSASRSVPALAPAASSTGSTPLTIPAGTSPAKYYILAKADGDGAVAETSETDNVNSRSIQVTAP